MSPPHDFAARSSSSSSFHPRHQPQRSTSSSSPPSPSAAPASVPHHSHLAARSRLSNISRHIAMAAPANPSVFTAAVVPQAPEDPLFGLMRAYKQDTSDKKVDLGIGAYRDNNAKPWVLPVVKKADELLRSDPNLNHEYLPIAGLPEFTSAAQRLILGADSPAIKENRVISLQTISGTGAVHLGGLFLSKFHPSQPKPTIYLSSPTWANHTQIFSNVHLRTATYPYFSPATRGLDITGMLDALRAAPRGSIILLHACPSQRTSACTASAQARSTSSPRRAHRRPRQPRTWRRSWPSCSGPRSRTRPRTARASRRGSSTTPRCLRSGRPICAR
ncbi:aspartate aminotransferase [Histoplasma capsulatum G186AR]|uniref:Aspartate aminotransferase n=1 Tax=Ajellomyces capsulatus (strain G186AR / H82 / ATCC MYA-2454 / RMSCC 2432) TaxID=447093 RepID=C0NX61_AJECG|nr:aspartate aminotransferase [Histoplasma capsulatum G186AR]EEH03927.1 aspartate aminotransferase [Histoplasma capsulatum G186AR]